MYEHIKKIQKLANKIMFQIFNANRNYFWEMKRAEQAGKMIWLEMWHANLA